MMPSSAWQAIKTSDRKHRDLKLKRTYHNVICWHFMSWRARQSVDGRMNLPKWGKKVLAICILANGFLWRRVRLVNELCYIMC